MPREPMSAMISYGPKRVPGAQADFLSRSLVQADPKKLDDLHLIISIISRPEHLTLFELGVAKKLDFAFAGPQSLRVAQLLEDGVLEIGAIHTYVELYARLLVDLAPNVVLVCAEQADREGNLYTGPNTEDTPVIVETAFGLSFTLRHGLAIGHVELDRAPSNNSIGFGFFLYARLDSLEQFFHNVTSPREFRKGRT